MTGPRRSKRGPGGMSGPGEPPASRPIPGHRTGPPPLVNLTGPSEAADTMLAWERFLTGHPQAVTPAGNFVVTSWRRSQALGVDPASRAAPLAARGDGLERIREGHADLLAAVAPTLRDTATLLAGAHSIILLTNAEGVVLEAVGDPRTLDAGQDIHLMGGGDWREEVIGTNGIGTALASGRPSQIHAAEHFCEGIKAWSCAAAPIHDPVSGAVLGVVDISGPPSTYQRGNLTLAVLAARQIEAVLAERAACERQRLLEICLDRAPRWADSGVIALDRHGRVVHATERATALLGRWTSAPPDFDRLASSFDGAPRPPGRHLPGPGLPATHLPATHLPDGVRPEWCLPVVVDGRSIGTMLVIPPPSRPVSANSVSANSAAANPIPARPADPRSEADAARSDFRGIVGRSAALAAAVERARRLVGKRVPVLIEGETGTGKELFARAIHGGERQGRTSFIAFNCGAVSRELIGGELFGHVRGAFTGATAEGRPGRFELAHGGTLCLDEIGELPLDLQPFLLRALEEGVVYRLGDAQPRRVDVRLLALTNRNLRQEVEAGRFRRDLYYRIGVVTVRVPPLRERGGDIDMLVQHFNHVLAVQHGVSPKRFAPAVLAALRDHSWPGNVRELRNVVESLLLTVPQETVAVEDLPPELMSADPGPGGSNLDGMERSAIRDALNRHAGNLTEAARALGISRSTLYRKLDRYGRP